MSHDKETFAYLLGLATADGYLARERNGNSTVRIMGTDLEHMKKVAAVMGANLNPMTRGKDWPKHYKTCYRAQKTGSLAAMMLERGISEERKSYNQGPLDLMGGEIGPFLRGFTDGDGSVLIGYKERGRLSYSGGEGVLEFTKKLLEGLGTRMSLYDQREKYGWSWVSLQGSGANIWPALRVIYPEGGYLAIERKREVARRILHTASVGHAGPRLHRAP